MLPVPYSKVLIPISINISWMASPIPEAIASGGIGMCTIASGEIGMTKDTFQKEDVWMLSA